MKAIDKVTKHVHTFYELVGPHSGHQPIKVSVCLIPDEAWGDCAPKYFSEFSQEEFNDRFEHLIPFIGKSSFRLVLDLRNAGWSEEDIKHVVYLIDIANELLMRRK